MTGPRHNPFRDLAMDALVAECHRLATDLRTRRKRTAESRATMAEHVSALLRVVATRLGIQRGVPGSPEYAIGTGQSLPDAYRQYYLEELGRVRRAILERAATLALGADASAWIGSLGCGVDGDAYARAVGSDAGLLKQLKALENLRMSRSSPDASN